MSKALEQDCIVEKSFNNNIVLAKQNDKEKILFSKGIGYNKKKGHVIEKGIRVDKIFIIENKENINNFNTLLNSVDKEFIGVCEEIIYDIAKGLNESLDERIHIGLTDHLWFALKRLRNNEEIQNPFAQEIEALYSLEFELAKAATFRLEDVYDIQIPYGEIGFIALHIHSARNSGKLSNIIRSNYIIKEIIEYIEDNMGYTMDKKSLDYARFLTHIKFAIERISRNILVKNDFIGIIKRKYKKSYKISKGISAILEKELESKVADDEIAYMAMHVERIICGGKR